MKSGSAAGVSAWRRRSRLAPFAARADVIVTNNVRHFAPDRLAEIGLLVQTADEFLVHQWWLDPEGVGKCSRRWLRPRAGHR